MKEKKKRAFFFVSNKNIYFIVFEHKKTKN